ncbi:SIMPL domain-containing protein [Halopseudomonas salegens]|uniref:Predicted secreted protein n=1 Tax=Halopseudomonas salegens TaxID=1434072 RepID=A0A1H2GYR7_9GAMM|nr:SIMPL domain-containing protein [Halopseudomonas salegens]SDU24736.1 Predicted secreted protein [Halopseudomonas salegens]
MRPAPFTRNTLTRTTAVIGLLASLLLTLPAQAETTRYNQISLRAEAQQAINNDTLSVVLYAEEQHADPATLAERISQRVNQALDTAREVEGVQVASGSRRSHPVYDDKRKNIVAWRERAEIRLESNDFATLSILTGELLTDLSLSGMQFSLSPAARQASEDALLADAIDAFRQRADLVTEQLGGSGYQIVSLNLQTQSAGPHYPRAATMMRAEADSVTPDLEAGEASVSVHADGVIEVEL